MSLRAQISSLCVGVLIFWAALAQAADADQPAIIATKVRGRIPSQHATIVKYGVDTKDPNDYAPTGNLSIEYSDGTKVVEKVPPTRKNIGNESVFNEVGFNDLKISSDKRTIVWSELFENPGTSYPIPEVLAIYRSGNTITHVRQGQMLWDWTFLDGAQQIAAVWGLTHGSSAGDYQLYDAKTGRMVSEFMKDTDDKSRGSDIPAWVQRTDKKLFPPDNSRNAASRKKPG